ncbi:hypothetical protein [Micromonospora sp. 067-2]|uniref:hypothetical protein n=1 Tax=Micromonospora sp. 067-2 TaxID=2789270 RepID=UPI0039790E40
MSNTTDETAVLAAVRALEAASAPLRPQDWPALAEQRLRSQVQARLAVAGRQLINVKDQNGKPLGYVSAWSDDIVEQIAERRHSLRQKDLAILALIYLHTHVLANLLAEEIGPIGECLEAHEGPNGRDVIGDSELPEILRRLHMHELIDSVKRLGPAFKRLSPAQQRRLDENLVLLCRPNSQWAKQIRESRVK